MLERIGCGGMGEVFLAVLRREDAFEKRLVIKRILPSFTSNAEFLARFTREARIAALLNHQNIVQIYDYGRVGDEAFIAMEYVDGADLRSLLDRLGSPPAPLAVSILAGVARALDYAHRLKDPSNRPLGLVHRDVSPGNILVSREGEIKLTDFGLVAAQDPEQQTDSGGLKGKYAYMSPEQTYGDPVDARSDLFSWGVVAYELFAGTRPFVGQIPEMLTAIRKGDHLPLDRPGLPPPLVALVHQCLSVQRDDRPETAAQIVDLLERISQQPALNEPLQQLGGWVRQALHQRRPSPPSVERAKAPPPTAPIERTLPAQHRFLVASSLGHLPDIEAEAKSSPQQGEAKADSQGAALVRADRPVTRVLGRRRVRSWLTLSLILLAVVGVGLAMAEWVGFAPPAHRDLHPAEGSQPIELVTRPEGARIFLDQEFIGTSPLRIERRHPSHPFEVRAEREGYQPAVQVVRVSDLPASEDGPVLLTLTLAPVPSTLTVRSRPVGALVSLDGIEVGPTPAEIVLPKPGQYRVSLSAAGYRPLDAILEIQPGESLERDFDLIALVNVQIVGEPRSARTTVSMESGVQLDCELPCSLQVEAGRLTLTASQEGYRDHESTHVVEQDCEIRFELTPRQRRVFVSWESNDLVLSGAQRQEIPSEPIRQTIQFTSTDPEFSGTIRAILRRDGSGEAILATLALRCQPWGTVAVDGAPLRDTPVELTDLRFVTGTHTLELRIEGRSEPVRIDLAVSQVEQ